MTNSSKIFPHGWQNDQHPPNLEMKQLLKLHFYVFIEFLMKYKLLNLKRMSMRLVDLLLQNMPHGWRNNHQQQSLEMTQQLKFLISVSTEFLIPRNLKYKSLNSKYENKWPSPPRYAPMGDGMIISYQVCRLNNDWSSNLVLPLDSSYQKTY